MKSKKIFLKICTVVCLVALLAAICAALTSCMKIGMQKKNVIDRLNKAGAEIEYLRTTPITMNGQASYRIGDILLATMTFDDVAEEEGSVKEETLYIYFAQDKRSGDWLENVCKEYLANNKDDNPKWNVYRYDEVVMIGHYKILSIARSY